MKKAIQVIAKVAYKKHTNLGKYSCLKFQDIIKLKTLCVMYRVKSYMLPKDIQLLLEESYIHVSI